MAQNLLQMCKHAADRALINRPSSIVGSTDDVSRLMLSAAQDEGESLTRLPENGWVDLVREHTFDIAISGTVSAFLVDALVDNTVDFVALGVSVGDAVKNTADGKTALVTEIALVTTGTLGLDADIFTTPSAGTYIVYRQAHVLPSDYKYLVDDTLWDRNFYWELRGPLSPQKWQTYKSSVLGDTATTRRRWRIRNIDGTGKKFWIDPPPGDDAELVFEYMSTGWCKSIDGTAQNEWLKDTDLPVLDQYLFRLGLTYRVLERLGLDYAAAEDEYETAVEQAIGRDTGGDTLSLTGPKPFSLLTTCNVPDTGYG